MSDYPNLKNAPITEAIIEFRFPPNPEIDFQKAASFYEKIKNDYPKKEVRNLKQISFSITEGKKAETALKDLGPEILFIQSEDGKKIIQFRMDRFTFSKVDKYKNWDDFSSEVLKVWRKYTEHLQIKDINRMGVRFLNNLNLPKPQNTLGEYLNNPPRVPSGLPKGIAGFLTQINLVEEEIPASAIVTQSLDPNKMRKEGDFIPVIFDIDVFYSGKINVNDQRCQETLSKLRDFKNDIFFKSLTKKGLELYK